MSICKSKYTDGKTGKEMSNAQNKCCFKISMNVPDDLTGEAAGAAQMLNGMNNKVICDDEKLSKSTCSKSGAMKALQAQMSHDMPSDFLEKMVSFKEVTWCPKKMSAGLIVGVVIGGIVLLAIIIFLISKRSQVKMRVRPMV